MKEKSSSRFWITLTVFSLMGQVAWIIENMYFNVFIYKMFHASPSQISAMVAASAVSATLTTVLIGALSDRLGKRKAFIWLGYVLWGLSIFAFVFLKKSNLAALSSVTDAAALGISLTILLDCLMTFFGSSANDAAFNAWLTDSATKENRGAAEGINAMMPLVAILVVFGGFMFFDLDREESWSMIFAIIGSAVILVGISGIFMIREPHITPSSGGYLKSIFYGFSPKTVSRNKLLYLRLLAFVVFNVAIQIFMPYLILYYEIALGLENYVLIMAPAILLASAFTAFWGKVFDGKGFRFSALISLSLLIFGALLLFLVRQTAAVFIASLLMMSGYLSGMAVFGASIRELTPFGMSGRFQGIRIFSQVLIPGMVGPFLGTKILANAEMITNSDGTTSFIPNANIFLGACIAAVLVLPFLFFKEKKKRETLSLKTPFETGFAENDTPFDDYPRPTMKRNSYLCLNGLWDFSLENPERKISLGKIRVPFPPESRLSGIGTQVGEDDVMIYRKDFSLPRYFKKDRVILHFGAVDENCQISLNGSLVGSHNGGYLPFSLDITDFLQEGENRLTVRAKDPMDTAYPYGKQTKTPGGMWYTKVSGIWQTVWLESIPKDPIEKISISTTLSDAIISVEGGLEKKRLILQEENGAREICFTGSRLELNFPNPQNWTPENPYLYRFTLISGEDRVESYFALRTIDLEERNGKTLLCLNGKPYYFHGLLDQGYFPDGIFLPATSEGFRQDILKAKACGFNMLRKHIKLEPDLFYYECDKLGMAVFQDMINAGSYSFLRDTALPTLGIKKGVRHSVPDKTKEAFMETSRGIQDLLFSHPSVVYYTVFNEGWGQFDADGCFEQLKKRDPSRIYDATSGWFRENKSDVVSEHVYFKPIKLRPQKGKALILSEFGGYSFKEKGHVFNEKDTYGYRFFKDKDGFQKALISLYEKEVAPCLEKGLCATVLTQLSDVEDETNGILTYDRQILKVNEDEMRRLASSLQETFRSHFRA